MTKYFIRRIKLNISNFYTKNERYNEHFRKEKLK